MYEKYSEAYVIENMEKEAWSASDIDPFADRIIYRFLSFENYMYTKAFLFFVHRMYVVKHISSHLCNSNLRSFILD